MALSVLASSAFTMKLPPRGHVPSAWSSRGNHMAITRQSQDNHMVARGAARRNRQAPREGSVNRGCKWRTHVMAPRDGPT
eukprot:4403801-Prymnesium_polylepis.1